MSDELMTIRQMCDAFEVTPRTLRFYESRELISPERRGQHRLYNRRDRARLKLILQGKRFGFSLEEIRQLLELYDPRGDNLPQLSATLGAARVRLADMIRQQEELGRAIAELSLRIEETEHLMAARKAS
ncbi:MAG TPA: MerR family DNA-binding transcriptional regulator [Paracoccus sp. (in: a-proteobacteria)]|uniref:MerR family transcriptional regulator n=1 Tax=uncultured Paracoccus sp. TaxID=189685 RepID=UPI002601EC15|nr:MerR family DNA-binding transcriptional regulator [uncultured Paracoccus sp.]HMQ42325.1 MerR family DNA-binding transcriptional regulator [Paracoccus sp. (in: a-proteobacteria)]HMR35992.1 MerR family DNA-binding transcriptional regulator [Paracoccus sp. (in: a-proteobacteria)]